MIAKGALIAALVAAALVAAGTGDAAWAQQPTPAPTPQWTVSHPTGGPAYDLSIGLLPLREGSQIVYAAGVDVQSTVRGDTWRHLPGTAAVTNIRAADGSTVYASNEAGQAFRSGNKGAAWQRIRIRDDGPPVRILAVSPDYESDETAYAITLDEWRLYRTGSAGTRWAEVTMSLDAHDRVGALAFSPLHDIDEVVFVGTDLGFYRWVPSEQRWRRMAAAGGTTPVFGPDAGPAYGQGIVVPAEYGNDPLRATDPVVLTIFAFNDDGLFRSDDDGATWRRIDLPASVRRVNDLAVSNRWPEDPILMVAAAGDGVLGAVSSNDGATWQTVASKDGMVGTAIEMSGDFAWRPLPDYRGFPAYLPLAMKKHAPPFPSTTSGTREAFLATDGAGVLRTQDAGRSWTPTADSFSGVAITAVAALGDESGPALAGSEAAGLYRSADGGRMWSFADVQLPRGRGQDIHRLVVSPAFAADRTVFLGATSGVWVSRDGGQTFVRTTGPAPARAVAVSPAFATDRTVFAQGQISTDGGQSWQPSAIPADYELTSAAFSPDYATDRTIWAGSTSVSARGHRHGLLRSGDGGATWAPVAVSALDLLPVLDVTVARFDLSEPPRVFVGTGSGLVVSEDGGASWRRRQDATSRPTHGLAARIVRTPALVGLVLAATDDGATWSRNRGVDWTRKPQSPAGLTSAAITADGRALLVGAPTAVGRLTYDPAARSAASAGPPAGPPAWTR